MMRRYGFVWAHRWRCTHSWQWSDASTWGSAKCLLHRSQVTIVLRLNVINMISFHLHAPVIKIHVFHLWHSPWGLLVLHGQIISNWSSDKTLSLASAWRFVLDYEACSVAQMHRRNHCIPKIEQITLAWNSSMCVASKQNSMSRHSLCAVTRSLDWIQISEQHFVADTFDVTPSEPQIVEVQSMRSNWWDAN